MRVANAVAAVLFVLAAAAQYNDPDGVYWGGLYLGAASACVLRATGRRSWRLPAAVGAIAAAWGAVLATCGPGSFHTGELFEAWAMESAAVEEGREMGGLLIVAGWMLLLAASGWREEKLPPGRNA